MASDSTKGTCRADRSVKLIEASGRFFIGRRDLSQGAHESRRAGYICVGAGRGFFLTELTVEETNAEQLKREERALRVCIGSFRAADRMHSRDL
jgi:hypothetical protein